MHKKMPIYDLNILPTKGFENDVKKYLGKKCHL